MTLYKNKYRIESARCEHWDYAANGYYFVTICTQNRECFFSEVEGNEMYLSAIGEIVAEEWYKTAQIRPNVELDEWIVMPNHLHGIIVIKNQFLETKRFHRNVSTARLKSDSLGAIVGQFKSVCTKRIRGEGFASFGWQTRFYDSIIRQQTSLENVRKYIVNNPRKWELDRHNDTKLYM
jgi:putative transposase